MPLRVVMLGAAVALLGAEVPSPANGPLTPVRAIGVPTAPTTSVTIATATIMGVGNATPAPPSSVTISTSPITGSGNATPKPQ